MLIILLFCWRAASVVVAVVSVDGVLCCTGMTCIFDMKDDTAP